MLKQRSEIRTRILVRWRQQRFSRFILTIIKVFEYSFVFWKDVIRLENDA